MIERSFVILDRIGCRTEQALWSAGVPDWDSFISAHSIRGISPKRKQYFDRRLREAKQELRARNASYFADLLPCSDVWRIYREFRDDCIFLDIETSGYYGDVTVVGLYDGDDVVTLVKGRNLDSHILRKIFSRHKLLVTFNGISFDVPVLNRCFSRIVPRVPHLDLRFPLQRLGFTGGLKSIEKMLGISRNSCAAGVSGEDAVRLWHEYAATGNPDSLEILVEYNAADAVNLRPIADFVFEMMKKRMLCGM
ncbi:ribonuclease H-like domain-containing protein [Candidatus Woesearchaeota archaeon]|nr:ribonuclease H-like domain-containing protein [Candidatus Woesearchaeota archaeon]